jgi:thiopurine S-methyltransferase
MNTDFWLERWSRNEIGFHQRHINEYLVAHWPKLGIDANATVFVPMCGKSLDMRWLREHGGHSVLGVEIARSACTDFFREWGVEPAIDREGSFESLEAQGVKLLCGDFFALQLGTKPECRERMDAQERPLPKTRVKSEDKRKPAQGWLSAANAAFSKLRLLTCDQG